MNGFEATKYIRNNFNAPKKNIPIIALTASVLRTDLDKCRQAGMNAYIAKPFKAAQLITTIATTLNITLKSQQPKENIAHANYVAGATDLNYLRKYCDGEEDRMKMYISIYLNAAKKFEENLNVAIATNDRAEIASLMHNFKPKWITMGMNKSTDLGQQIEQLCTEPGNEQEITELIAALKEQNKLSITELA